MPIPNWARLNHSQRAPGDPTFSQEGMSSLIIYVTSYAGTFPFPIYAVTVGKLYIATVSLVPRLPLFFVHWFVFSMIYGRRVLKNLF